jgi:hypothetical protein
MVNPIQAALDRQGTRQTLRQTVSLVHGTKSVFKCRHEDEQNSPSRNPPRPTQWFSPRFHAVH